MIEKSIMVFSAGRSIMRSVLLSGVIAEPTAGAVWPPAPMLIPILQCTILSGFLLNIHRFSEELRRLWMIYSMGESPDLLSCLPGRKSVASPHRAASSLDSNLLL